MCVWCTASSSQGIISNNNNDEMNSKNLETKVNKVKWKLCLSFFSFFWVGFSLYILNDNDDDDDPFNNFECYSLSVSHNRSLSHGLSMILNEVKTLENSKCHFINQLNNRVDIAWDKKYLYIYVSPPVHKQQNRMGKTWDVWSNVYLEKK